MVRRVFLIVLIILSSWVGSEAFGEDKNTSNVHELPNTINHSIRHRRPSRKVSKHFGVGIYSDFSSQYVSHGLPSSLGAVWQPSFTLEYYGVGLNVWTSMPLSSEPNQGEFNEVDFTLYYHRSFKKINFRTWLLGVVLPNNNPASLNSGSPVMEWAFRMDGPVGPITLFTDITVHLYGNAGSTIWDMGIGYHRNLPLNFAIDTSVLFAVANGKFTAGIAPVGTVPFQFEFSLAFPWQPIAGLTVTPKMSVSTLLTRGLRAGSPDPTLIWGGLSLAYEFGDLR